MEENGGQRSSIYSNSITPEARPGVSGGTGQTTRGFKRHRKWITYLSDHFCAKILLQVGQLL